MCSFLIIFRLDSIKDIQIMKKILCSTLLLVLPFSTAFSQETGSTKVLDTQKVSALPAHKTTRLQWTKLPQPKYENSDLKEQDRAAIIRVYANESGKITKATVQESTGLKSLDDILVQAVLNAEVKPHIESDTAVATIGFQTFNLKYINDDENQCDYDFKSEVWKAQQVNEKTKFTYRTQPTLSVDTDDLEGHNRSIEFKFKVNKHGEVKKAKIKKGSGVYDLDQQVLQAVLNANVQVPRKFWIYKKSRLKDSIQFKLDGCE